MDAANISLHSAAESCDLEAAELLLKEKIDIYSKDKNNKTPLHILMQQKIEIIDWDHRGLNDREQKVMNEKFIKMLLKHSSTDPNLTNETLLLNFHAACTLENYTIAEELLEKITDINQPISDNSSIWPGYTALHFAVRCSIEITKMLVKKGANLLACDDKGVTPLSLCIKILKIEVLHSILTCVTAWKDILFSDGETKLMDYMAVLHDGDSHKNFVKSMGKKVGASLSKDSPLWPGQTILHIAVTLLQEPKLDMITDILSQSADVTTRDVNGLTPVHLAFCQNKMKFVNELFQYHKKVLNPSNKDDLSHLHIACIVNNTSLVRRLLTIEENINIAYNGKPLPNVKPGWTPLHTACVTEHSIVAKMLLEAGANLRQTDAKGFTAIHRLFRTNGNKHLVLDVLAASKQFKECVAEDTGLTHLHVMTAWKNTKAVKRLLDLGADVEATIENDKHSIVQWFVGYRPLHLALRNHHVETIKLLLERGADILVKKGGVSFPLYEVLSGKYDESLLEPFVSLLWADKKLQKRVEKEIGLTVLHLVCYALDLEKIKNLLKKRIRVDARVHEDSPIWPGFTPLHVLTHLGVAFAHRKDVKENVDKAINLLLDRKADVTVANSDGNTPVHLTLKSRFKDQRSIRASLLMKHHRDFIVNPSNKQGLSHFHIACLLCNLTAVKGFLQHGIDVNQPVNGTFDEYAGESPLHMVLNPTAKRIFGVKLQLQVVDILLEHGAKVDAVDARGWTPIHNVAEFAPPRQKLLDRLVSIHTDMNKETNNGETPFEILIHHGASVTEVKLFMKYGSRVNSYNRINDKGYMAMIATIKGKQMNNILNFMINLPDIVEIDERGRNAVFNIFCDYQSGVDIDDYATLIESLIESGCDINHQDRQGKTPLHVAVELACEDAVCALLVCGADVNLVDADGQSPYSYRDRYFSISLYRISRVLTTHLSKLRMVGLEVSPLNDDLLTEADHKIEIDEITLRDELEKTKEVRIGQRGLTLHDFVFERNVAKIITLFTPAERDIVGHLLESINYEKFSYLCDLLKLQYRKVMGRLPLVEPAAKSLIGLLGFPLPDLCVEVVLKFLTNGDLKSLVSATIEDEDEDLKMVID